VTENVQGTPRPSAHPEPGLIAAHADHRLTGDERTRMVEHLAGCSDCYEQFAETLRFASEESGEAVLPGRVRERGGRLVAFARRPAFRIGVGLAAAVLLLAIPFGLYRAGLIGRPSSPVSELVAAVGERRLVEPRLTGGFRYARLLVMRSGEGPQGLDAQPFAVIAAVAKIRERAEKDPSPEALGALGVTYLVSGDVGSAVKSLESATTQAPENAQLWSDLAAAYLARATQADEPADIPKALEAAERAIELTNAPTEAWFNRALALEALHLDDPAKKAWEDYLARDAASGWADEARQHLDALKKVRHSSADDDKARVRAALDEGAPAVDRLADESPQPLRGYLDEELLPNWADATLVAHADSSLHRERARVIGEALARTTTDPMSRDTASALGQPVSPSSRDPLRSQAQGFKDLFEARRLYEQQLPSCDQVRRAARDLDSGGSPYAAWARLQSVIACLFPAGEQAKALVELDEMERLAERRGYVQLLGRVRGAQGLIDAYQTHLTVSLERYRLARSAFQQTRDAEGEAMMLGLIAEDLYFLGENRGAWRERIPGLGLLGYVQNSRRRHGILSAAESASVIERLPRSARHFGNLAVDTAVAWSQPAAVSHSLVRRAGIQHALGSDDRALADLAEARRRIAQVAEKYSADRLTAEADAAEGEILVSSQPQKAARLLERALSYFAAVSPTRVPPLHHFAARAQMAQGREDAAAGELQAGIEALESQRTPLEDSALQVSFFDQALPLFEDMVRFQIASRRDPEQGLAFVERSRARQLVESVAGGAVAPLDPEALRRALPEGLALVYYMALSDRLFEWALTRDGVHFVERRLSHGDLSQQIAAFRSALEERASVDVLRQEGGRLHDELVRPLLPFLGGQRTLVIVPDSLLQSVAFASLWDRRTSRYLIEDYLLAVAPSGTASVQASVRSAALGAAPVALVVGNPKIERSHSGAFANLPGAETEAVEVASLYASVTLLTGKGATKAEFLRGVSRSQVVHYAGHAAAGDDSPSTARLLLARDPESGDGGALYLRELDRRSFPRTRLVVLAACRTAAGVVSRVEGALSLGRPFLAAGVPDVVASMWDVDDAVSRRFMVALHRALLTGRDPSQALRATQISFLRHSDPSLAHPANWAAFICMGGLDLHSLPQGVIS
jgi:CHAT domain-containing protein